MGRGSWVTAVLPCIHPVLASAGILGWARQDGLTHLGRRSQSHSAGSGREPVSWDQAKDKKTAGEKGRDKRQMNREKKGEGEAHFFFHLVDQLFLPLLLIDRVNAQALMVHHQNEFWWYREPPERKHWLNEKLSRFNYLSAFNIYYLFFIQVFPSTDWQINCNVLCEF